MHSSAYMDHMRDITQVIVVKPSCVISLMGVCED